MTKKKRINYSKITPGQARDMIGSSKGMSKAKFDRLWRIGRGYTSYETLQRRKAQHALSKK